MDLEQQQRWSSKDNSSSMLSKSLFVPLHEREGDHPAAIRNGCRQHCRVVVECSEGLLLKQATQQSCYV